MRRNLNRWIVCTMLAVTLVVLGLSGVVVHGVCSIRAIPPEILIRIGMSGCTVFPYNKDPEKTITDKDFQAIKDALVRNCFTIGLYGGGAIAVDSKTNITVEFFRRETMLSISLINTNNAWTVTEVAKETTPGGISRGCIDGILDGASTVLP